MQSKVDGALMLDPLPEEVRRQQASALLAHMPLVHQVRAQAQRKWDYPPFPVLS